MVKKRGGNKREESDNKRIFYWLAPVFILLVIAVLLFVQYDREQAEMQKVLGTFTCNCCDSTLLASDEICAKGYKEEIRDMQDEGLHDRELFHGAAMLLGLGNIIDPELRLETAFHFAEFNPEGGARAEVTETGVNLGNVSESKTPIVLKDFTIRSVGTEDLLIHAVDTSCSCLSGKFVTEDWESPEYGRFSDPNGQLIRVEPGDEVRLRVRYDARINSFFRGYELRHVRVYTNDVTDAVTMFTIEATHVD